MNNRGINERAWPSLTGGGLYKEAEALSPEISLRKLSFPFLVTSFSRMNKDAYDEKKYPYYTQSNSDNIRKLFKEITCQANGEYSFAYVAYNLSDKFSAFIPDNYHQIDGSIKNNRCQENLRGGR